MDTPLVEITLPKLHPAQKQIVDDPARFRVLACGRRWGKSFLAAIICIMCAINGGKVWWVSEDYPTGTVVWRFLKELISSIPGVVVNESERMISFPTFGIGYIQIKSSESSLRAESLDLCVCDEFAQWKNLESVWTEQLRATLTDRKGKALFLSTPNGINYFHTLFGYGLDANRKDWSSYQLPTVSNPYLDPKEIEEAKDDLPDRAFRQEYLAEFMTLEGAVFRDVDKVSILQPQAGPLPGHVYHFGLDWGRTNDSTAISVFDITARQQVALDRFTKIGWALQRGRIKVLNDKWKPRKIFAEYNSMGGPNIEELQAEGLPIIAFNTNNTNKNELIQKLELAIECGAMDDEKKGILLLNDPVQRLELISYESKQLQSGAVTYNAPSGSNNHDDTVIALALSIWGLKKSSGGATMTGVSMWPSANLGMSLPRDF